MPVKQMTPTETRTYAATCPPKNFEAGFERHWGVEFEVKETKYGCMMTAALSPEDAIPMLQARRIKLFKHPREDRTKMIGQ